MERSTARLRGFVGLLFLGMMIRCPGYAQQTTPSAAAPPPIVLENDSVKWEIAPDGRNLHFIDKRDGHDYCSPAPNAPFASIREAGANHNASKVSYENGRLAVEFAESGARAEIGVAIEKRFIRLEAGSVRGDQVQELTIVDIPLTLKGNPEEPFGCCALALNLKTNVPEIPGPNSRLRALCCRRFGLEGAKVALIACPQEQLREVMKEVVSMARELPQSPIGGPWALDAQINRGSYLFDLEGISEETVDRWIQLAATLGMNQIDFNVSFRYGDFRPRPDRYPKGRENVKAVIDKLHARGIAAGLHTYSFFIAKDTPYVTPAPDNRLGKDATFTLAEALTPDAAVIPVAESTKDLSTETGFFIRNSVTVQIEDELVTYTGLSKESPFAFTGCTRGACGTKPAPHEKGAKVHHLKECFGLFAPDPDSTLLTEIAAHTADTFNACGFDMIYLDALDGEDVLAGGENGWYYGSKFVFEIAERLNKPALFEMSTFHHHLWCVRSRMGAWDHPCRSHKRFVDVHCAANRDGRGMFLPMNLGWWAVQTWTDGASETYSEPTFSDDIEYLMCKCLGTDTGFSLMGVTPDNLPTIPAYQRLAPIFKQYEGLRYRNYFPETIKARLRAPREEFTLEPQADGTWRFRPVQYEKHKIQGIDGWSNRWVAKNRFGAQPLEFRIEALMSAAGYDAEGSVVLEDFSKPDGLADRASEQGVTATLESSSAQVKVGPVSGCYAAASERPAAAGSWSRIGKVFSPPMSIAKQKGLGVWVYGDAQGELLNLQLRSPSGRAIDGIGDHYILVDFTGWRYFDLVELEGGRIADYVWPYGGSAYAVYREPLDYGQIQTFSLWYNNVPGGKKVTCCLSPVKALPLVKTRLRNPKVMLGGKSLAFPTEIETGCYLEFRSVSDCKLYGPKGELLSEVKPEGEVPALESGDNPMEFQCEALPGVSPRAYLTTISRGELL